MEAERTVALSRSLWWRYLSSSMSCEITSGHMRQMDSDLHRICMHGHGHGRLHGRGRLLVSHARMHTHTHARTHVVVPANIAEERQ